MSRDNSANAKPIFRALDCCSTGSLAASTEMKTILSIPKTISRNVRVSRLIQASGLENSVKKSVKNSAM